MMSASDRVKLLLIIWGSFAVAAGWSFSGDPRNFSDVILGFIYAASALVATGLVLRHGSEESVSSKLKRSDSDVYRAIDSMDDEELRALRRRLMIDNEASVPMQDLLSREQRQSQ